MANPTGEQVIAKALQDLGVSVIFGLVGVPVAGIAEEAINLGIRFIGLRNEQACSYAATAYGYLTGRPGVCLLVGGPGILHAIAGVGNASANAWPTLFLGGNSEQILNGKGAFQEMDSVSVLTPHTKFAIQPSSNDPYTITHAIHRAYRLCWYGRPGPTYVDLPADLIMTPTVPPKTRLQLKSTSIPSPPKPAAQPSDITLAANLLKASSAPLVVIGKGAAYSRSESAINTLINSHNLPFLPTPMGKGVVPDTQPLNTTTARSAALGNADVIVLIGARLNWILHYGEPPKFSPHVKFIQLDISAEELGRVNGLGEPAVSLFGDIGVITSQLHSALGSWTAFPSLSLTNSSSPRSYPYLTALATSAKKNDTAYSAKALKPTPPNAPLTYERAYHIINSTLSNHMDDIVLVAEGANTMDISRSAFQLTLPRQRLDAGTYATMGVGCGYAVAAEAAYNWPAPKNPHGGKNAEPGGLLAGTPKRIVCLFGDSAFGFSGMEIETMSRYKMPVLIFVMNNSGIYHGDSLSEVEWRAKQSQSFAGDTVMRDRNRKGLRATSLLWETRYEKMAEMVGGTGYFVKTEEELEEATRRGWAEKEKVVLINVVIEAGLGKSISLAWEMSKEGRDEEGRVRQGKEGKDAKL
jgi:2-hydroxyacyl-CoA lyase 1